MTFRITHGLEVKTEIFSTSVGVPFNYDQACLKVCDVILGDPKASLEVVLSGSDLDCLGRFVPASKWLPEPSKNNQITFKSSLRDVVMMIKAMNDSRTTFVAA